jgi:hypothetical protein
MTAHEQLASYASNISKECLNNVSDMICKGMAPACDRNETMVVELLSRQDCERIISWYVLTDFNYFMVSVFG